MLNPATRQDAENVTTIKCVRDATRAISSTLTRNHVLHVAKTVKHAFQPISAAHAMADIFRPKTINVPHAFKTAMSAQIQKHALSVWLGTPQEVMGSANNVFLIVITVQPPQPANIAKLDTTLMKTVNAQDAMRSAKLVKGIVLTVLHVLQPLNWYQESV